MDPRPRRDDGRGWRRWLPSAILCGVVVLLGLAVVRGLTLPFDRAVLLALAPPPRLIDPIVALTWLGDSAPRAAITAIVAAMLLARRHWRQAAALVPAVVGGAVLNWGLKQIVMRPRPDLLEHLDHVTSSSFPSGHSANSAILYLSLALLVPPRHRRAAVVAAVVLAAAIGTSRVALAVHWPSDVAAGWCVGLAWVLAWRDGLTWNQSAQTESG